jgi:hypothetical protein
MELLFAGLVIGPSGSRVELIVDEFADPVRNPVRLVDTGTEAVLYDGIGTEVTMWIALTEPRFGRGMEIDRGGESVPLGSVLGAHRRRLRGRLIRTCDRGEDMPWCWYPPG